MGRVKPTTKPRKAAPKVKAVANTARQLKFLRLVDAGNARLESMSRAQHYTLGELLWGGLVRVGIGGRVALTNDGIRAFEANPIAPAKPRGKRKVVKP